jgi:tRNA dimethylallyltransferase
LEQLNYNKILTILGPTASGKTNLACNLAYLIDGEILSADSRQVYRNMDIGTGKDLAEFTVNGKRIPYHLIDIKDPGYKYNIAEYEIDYHAALSLVQANNKLPILCGGSGLYIEAALSGTDYLGILSDEALKIKLSALEDEELDQLHKNIDATVKAKIGDKTKARKIRAILVDDYLKSHPDWNQRRFKKLDYIIFGVDIDRDLRREKISQRLSYRLNNGLIEEAQHLFDSGLSHEDMAYYGLEYKWLSRYIQKEITKKELFEGLRTAIHQFAKRQMTWFRKMEKEGYVINWLEASLSLEDKCAKVIELYSA